MSDVCHQVIVSDPDGDGWDACDRPAVGVRAALDDGDPYPVCVDHLCGGCGYWHDRCTPRPAPPERAILTDLIAELRVINSEADFPPLHDMADRAEVRLRRLGVEGIERVTAEEGLYDDE